MTNIILNALIDFAIFSGSVLLYTLVGAYQNIDIWKMKWNWKIWLNGLVKYLALGAVIVGLSAEVFLLLDRANAQNINIVNAQAIAPPVILAIVLLASAGMIAKTIAKLSTGLGLTDEQIKQIQALSYKTDENTQLVITAPGLPTMPDDYIAKKLALEKEGGIGSVYSVPIGSYAAFRDAVNGNGYDIDNAYSYQCWDGAALLWQQLGLVLYTGNGLAIGCWDLKRDVNKYDKFDLINDVNSLQLGDVVVMRPNHIGFFNGWNGNAMSILGQNQGGNGNGAPFNIVNIAKSAFAGAFRFKAWVIAPAPVPTPTPAPVTKSVTDEIVTAVIRGDYGNGADRKIKLSNEGYDPNAVQAAVNAKLTKTPTPVQPAPADNSAIHYTYKSGDTFGQVILNLGLNTDKGLWGADGDVNYYNSQLHAQGIFNNIPIGTTITLVRR